MAKKRLFSPPAIQVKESRMERGRINGQRINRWWSLQAPPKAKAVTQGTQRTAKDAKGEAPGLTPKSLVFLASFAVLGVLCVTAFDSGFKPQEPVFLASFAGDEQE
jgi:hypothetical protein